MVRMSAEERRESVIRVAMSEFARGGYHGTSTEAIARRVGVSQPYLFRLFPGKKAIFLAAATRCMRDTTALFARAVEECGEGEALGAMAHAYTGMITQEPEWLLLQMQVYVTVAAAEQAGDHEFGKEVRALWLELWETVRVPLGGDVDETTSFMAYGMLINCLVAMGFEPGHDIWAGLDPSARPQGPLVKEPRPRE